MTVRNFMVRAMALAFSVISSVVLLGCSEQPQPRQPTEQELHSQDFGTTNKIKGRHYHVCEDGRTLFVDFKEGGMSLELRRKETDPVTVLTASAQGLQYIGDTENATMTGIELRLMDEKGVERVCRKQ